MQAFYVTRLAVLRLQASLDVLKRTVARGLDPARGKARSHEARRGQLLPAVGGGVAKELLERLKAPKQHRAEHDRGREWRANAREEAAQALLPERVPGARGRAREISCLHPDLCRECGERLGSRCGFYLDRVKRVPDQGLCEARKQPGYVA